MSYVTWCCPAAFAAVLASSAAAQAPNVLPGNGIVTNPSGRNLVVRTSPPEITAFGYSLGDRVCSIGVGTQFHATEADSIINGEIWYRIVATADAVTRPIGCGPGDVAGWIVGRLKSGWAVRIAGDTTSFAGAVDSLVSQAAQSDDEESGEGMSFTVFRYLLLALGTLAGTVVLAIERAQSLKYRDWYAHVVAFEALVLCLANSLFAGLLLEAVRDDPDSGVLGTMVAAFAGPPWGFMVLGFTLAVLILKFVSFSKPRA